jgi:hypothetical protein
MRTLNKIITLVNCQYGAPMGRPDAGNNKPTDKRIFDCKVPLDNGGYDKGGAYWGIPSNLRVQYTKDLSYIHFYRVK